MMEYNRLLSLNSTLERTRLKTPVEYLKLLASWNYFLNKTARVDVVDWTSGVVCPFDASQARKCDKRKERTTTEKYKNKKKKKKRTLWRNIRKVNFMLSHTMQRAMKNGYQGDINYPDL